MSLNERAEEQGELWEELKVEHHWFHIVRSMILRGQLAEMGPVAWAVYCVIKAHTSLNDGKSFPSQDRIAKMIGASVDTVGRATERLIELAVIEKKKRGNRNEYFLLEKVPMTTQQGEVVAHGNATYIPMQFERIMNDIKEFAKSGAVNTQSPMHITLNMPVTIVNQGDNSTFTINNVSLSAGDDTAKQAWAQIVNKVNKVV